MLAAFKARGGQTAHNRQSLEAGFLLRALQAVHVCKSCSKRICSSCHLLRLVCSHRNDTPDTLGNATFLRDNDVLDDTRTRDVPTVLTSASDNGGEASKFHVRATAEFDTGAPPLRVLNVCRNLRQAVL